MRVIVTRPAAQGAAWLPALRAQGVEAVSLPLIGIEPPSDPKAVQAAWARLTEMVLVMFVSANAVSHFFQLRPPDMAWPVGTSAGSTGPGTSAALRATGVPAPQIIEPDAGGPYDTEALWRKIGHWPWAGRQALVVRGEDGRDWLAGQLRQAGCQVSYVAAYRRVPPALVGDAATLLRAALDQPAVHAWHFSSSEAIEHLLRAQPQAEWSHSRALCTHPRIADTARRAGFGEVSLVGVAADDVAAWLTARAQAATRTAGGKPSADNPRR